MNRPMWSALAAVLFLLLLPGAVRAADAPAPIGAAEAKALLEEAYKADDEEAMVAAIEKAAGLQDPSVIELVAKGMYTKHLGVIDAAIAALGANPHPSALKALLDGAAVARTRDITGYETAYAHLLREIGRKGSADGIDALTLKPFNALTYDVGLARLMGLSRVRERASIEALLELSRLAGGRGGKSGALSVDRGQFRPAFRVAMCVLTGRDEGLVPADWEKWWREHGAEFKMAPIRPPVPDDVRAAWEKYWGETYGPSGSAPAAHEGAPFARILKPTPEQVAAAVQGLKEAFKTKDYSTIAAALGEYGGVIDDEVVHEVAAGLRSKEIPVRVASIQTLGWMKTPAALRQLHREYRRGRSEWPKQEDLFAVLLQAIGRHGDPSSIEVLVDDPFRGLTIATGRARIFGLANIRTKQAVEELIKGTMLAGSSRPRGRQAAGEQRFQREFYVALLILTGQDWGSDLEAWRQWWRKNKGSFQVPKDRPAVPGWVSGWWTSFWDEPYTEAKSTETTR